MKQLEPLNPSKMKSLKTAGTVVGGVALIFGIIGLASYGTNTALSHMVQGARDAGILDINIGHTIASQLDFTLGDVVKTVSAKHKAGMDILNGIVMPVGGIALLGIGGLAYRESQKLEAAKAEIQENPEKSV